MLQDIENGSVKGSTATALDQHKDGGIYDEIGEEKVNPAQNGKPNGKAPSTEDVYAVPDKRKSNPPASPKLGIDHMIIFFRNSIPIAVTVCTIRIKLHYLIKHP